MSKKNRQRRRANRKVNRKVGRTKRANTVKKFIRKVDKKIADQSKKTRRAAKKVIKKAKEVGGIVLLAPFRIVMRKALKSKGITPPKNLTDLARSFFNNIVRRDGYDTMETFEPDSVLTYDSDNVDSFDPITISALISGVVSFFKKIKEKKDQGEPLTKTQETIAREVENVEKNVDNIKLEETDRTIGSMVKEYWWIVVILLFGVVYFAARKK